MSKHIASSSATTNPIVLNTVLEGLMSRYRGRVPDVPTIINAMTDEGIIRHPSDISNDHIAFRTLGVPCLGIASLEKIFLALGYTKRDYYYFPEKKLDAYWYAPPEDHYPRIFLSQLRVRDLSPAARQIIAYYTQNITDDPVDSLNLKDGKALDRFLHSSLWPLPTLADYETLAAESEYAAWTIYNRYYLNHFTISVHGLPAGYGTLAAFNDFLERRGFLLNDAGGRIKRSPDGLLLQSATVARMIPGVFADGETKPIAGSYVEFAERRVLPAYASLPVENIQRQHRREGFEAANADKIFESTYKAQTEKR